MKITAARMRSDGDHGDTATHHDSRASRQNQPDSTDRIARGKAIAGKYLPPHGKYLGTIDSWGLPVYEDSPQEWKSALFAEVSEWR